MAVAANAVGTFFRSAASPAASSTSINVPAGSTALWVTVQLDDSTTAITAPTWNGVSTTLIGTVNTTDALAVTKQYGLVNPASGSNSLSVTFSGGAPTGVHVCAVSFSGSLSSTVAGTFTGFVSQANNTAGSSNTVTVTSSSGDLAIASGNGNNSSAYTINQTNVYNQTVDFSDAASRAAGAATVVFTGTLTGLTATNCIAGCNVVQSASGTAPFYKSDWGIQKDLPSLPPQAAQTNINLFTNPIPINSMERARQYFLQPRLPDASQQTNINLFTNPIPFKQTDWPLMETFYKVPQTQAYNNLIYTTVVASPFYTQDFGTSHVIPDWASPVQYPNLVLQAVIQPPFYTQDFATSHVTPDYLPFPQYPNIVLQNFSTPFYTQDFSKPFVPTPAKPDQQAFNVNIFTNPVPFNQYDWSKPQSRTIAPDVNFLNIVLLNPVVAGTPFSQPSWPNTVGVPLASVNFFNMVLVASDVPFAQYDWSKTQFRTITSNINLPNIVLLNPVVTNPFFFQDFSRPFVPTQSFATVQPVNQNLFTNPVPLNQIDWSKPYRIVPIASDQNSLPNLILYQPVPSNPSNPLGIYSWMDLYKYVTLYPTTPALLQNLTLILPPPPPDTGPVGGWRWIDGVMRMREKQLDRRDQNADIKKAAAVISSLGGIARAKSLTAKQRSNIATKAIQTRWRK